jgi:PAS domain-containing protein
MGLPMTEARIWRDAYDSDPAIIYVLDPGLRFVRCNPAWDRFAQVNGKAELTGLNVSGTCIMDVTPNVLRDFYSTAYDSVRRFQRQWWHVFDCSSADVHRSFQMRVLPAGSDHILVINTVIREEPHEPQIAARIAEYTDAEGIATICANCRRVEHLTQPGRWDWVPVLLSLCGTLVQPGLCPFCFAFHYPGRTRIP